MTVGENPPPIQSNEFLVVVCSVYSRFKPTWESRIEEGLGMLQLNAVGALPVRGVPLPFAVEGWRGTPPPLQQMMGWRSVVVFCMKKATAPLLL